MGWIAFHDSFEPAEHDLDLRSPLRRAVLEDAERIYKAAYYDGSLSWCDEERAAARLVKGIRALIADREAVALAFDDTDGAFAFCICAVDDSGSRIWMLLEGGDRWGLDRLRAAISRGAFDYRLDGPIASVGELTLERIFGVREEEPSPTLESLEATPEQAGGQATHFLGVALEFSRQGRYLDARETLQEADHYLQALLRHPEGRWLPRATGRPGVAGATLPSAGAEPGARDLPLNGRYDVRDRQLCVRPPRRVVQVTIG